MADWTRLTNGSFKGVTFHYATPDSKSVHGIASEEVTDERRLQLIERPYIEGAKVNDLGGRAKSYTVEIHFFGPNYADNADGFEMLLDQGTAGVLILPTIRRPILAYYSKRTVTSRYDDGSAKTMSVTWIGTETKPKLVSPEELALLTHPSVTQTATEATDAVSTAQSVLKNNSFLSAVRTFEDGLSQSRRFSNTILTLKAGVLNRIQDIDANLQGTLGLLSQAIDSVRNVLAPESLDSTPTQGEPVAVTNSVTGNPLEDFSDPDTFPAAPDPLAPPAPTAVLPVSSTNVDTQDGAQRLIDKITESLQSDRDDLLNNAQGQVSDVGSAIDAVILAANAFIASVVTTSTKQVVVPTMMSMNEVLFFNGIDPSELQKYHAMNTHILDLAVIDAGTIVNL